MEHMCFYSKMGTAQCDRLFSLFPEPCLAVFFDSEMINKFTHPDLAQKGRIIDAYCAMLKTTYAKLAQTGVTSYFLESGLDRFIDEGRVTEIPSEYYIPISKEYRVKLLSALYNQTQAGKYKPVIIDASKFRISRKLVVTGISQDSVKIIYMHPEFGAITFIINEPSITFAIYEFLVYLKSSHLVLSKAETMRIIEKRLQQLGVKYEPDNAAPHQSK